MNTFSQTSNDSSLTLSNIFVHGYLFILESLSIDLDDAFK